MTFSLTSLIYQVLVHLHDNHYIVNVSKQKYHKQGADIVST